MCYHKLYAQGVRMTITYDTYAPKKAANLSINSDLLKKAKEYKINLSKHFEVFLLLLDFLLLVTPLTLHLDTNQSFYILTDE